MFGTISAWLGALAHCILHHIRITWDRVFGFYILCHKSGTAMEQAQG